MAFVRAKRRGDKTYYYLVEGVREGDQVRQRVVQYLGTSATVTKPGGRNVNVVSAVAYGAVNALHALCQRLDLVGIVNRNSPKGGGPALGKLFEAMVLNRCLDPVSKRRVPEWYQRTALPLLLELPADRITEDVLYRALDYFTPERILKIEKDLHRQVKKKFQVEFARVFYDLTSTYFEGHDCPLAEYGHSRDHRSDREQVNLAIAVNIDGVPITHEVLAGNTADVATVQDFATRLSHGFGLDAPVVVVDRGMVSRPNLAHLERLEFDFIVGLRMDATLQRWVARQSDSKFVAAPPEHERYLVQDVKRGKGRRRILVLNTEMAKDDAAWRQNALQAAEAELAKLDDSRRRPKAKHALMDKAHAVLKRHKVQGLITIRTGQRGTPRLTWARDEKAIRAAARLDGKYVLETTVDWPAGDVLAAYHQRDAVEKFIQTIKSIVELRPVYVRTETHVRAHVFVCVTSVLLLSLLRKLLKDAGQEVSAVEALRRLDTVMQVVLEQAGRLNRVTTRTSPEQEELLTLVQAPSV
jgi:transposase